MIVKTVKSALIFIFFLLLFQFGMVLIINEYIILKESQKEVEYWKGYDDCLWDNNLSV